MPTFIFYPLFIVLFGLNRWPLVAIGFLFAVVAMVHEHAAGLRAGAARLRRTARAMRLSTRGNSWCTSSCPRARRGCSPARSLPIAYSFIGVIAGEFVLSGAGMGFAIAFAYNSFDNAMMYGLIVLLFGFVGGINMLLYSWERRLYLRRGGR